MTDESERPTLTLYGTSACHLCELAERIVEGVEGPLSFTKVDISGSDELFRRYGLLIPVLRHPDGRELCWPFTTGQVVDFAAARAV